MKKSDWTMIIFVAVITGFVSFMITNSIMGDERKPAENVKATILFSDKVDEPNQHVFRVDDSSSGGAINQTVPITTGGGAETKNEKSNDDKKGSESNDPNQPNKSSGSGSTGNSNDPNSQNSSGQNVF